MGRPLWNGHCIAIMDTSSSPKSIWGPHDPAPVPQQLVACVLSRHVICISDTFVKREVLSFWCGVCHSARFSEQYISRCRWDPTVFSFISSVHHWKDEWIGPGLGLGIPGPMLWCGHTRSCPWAGTWGGRGGRVAGVGWAGKLTAPRLLPCSCQRVNGGAGAFPSPWRAFHPL